MPRRGSVPVMFAVCRPAAYTESPRRGLVPTPDAVIFAELLSPPLERASLLPSLSLSLTSLNVLFSRPPSRSMAVPLPDSLKGERSLSLSLFLLATRPLSLSLSLSLLAAR